MNIFWREIEAHYKALIAWSIGMFFLVVSGMAKFEGYSAGGSSANISQILKTFPKPVLAIFGMTGLDITKLIGYFGVLYVYIALMVAIHAGMLGAEVISKEERDRTSEFLYPKPISRAKVLSAKLAASFTNILILFGVTVVSSIWIVGFYNNGYGLSSQVMALLWGILFFQVLFFALGAFFAGFFKNPKLPATAVTSIIFLTYLFSVLVDLDSNLEVFKYLTPFRYFSPASIINSGHLDGFYAVATLLVSAILIVLTYITYDKRDLTV